MFSYAHTLSSEQCPTCEGLTLQIVTITEDTNEMDTLLFFTCLQCHQTVLKKCALNHYVINIRPDLKNLTRSSDTNWWSKPSNP